MSAYIVGSQPDNPCWTGKPASLEDAWRGSLSRLPVDRLAQEVGMAVVAGVLRDHVADDPSDAGRLDIGRRSPDGPLSPSDRSTSPSAARERATFSSHNAHKSSGALPAKCHAQSESQSRVSQGEAMSRPRS